MIKLLVKIQKIMNSYKIIIKIFFLLTIKNVNGINQYKEKAKHIQKRNIFNFNYGAIKNNNSFWKSQTIYSSSTRNLSENNNICLKNDVIGEQNYLCIECNTKDGFYPIYISNHNSPNYSKYFQCYKKEDKPDNYYFNIELKAYEKCYESCKKCFGYGDINNNNCSKCKEGYIFMPEIENSKNCIEECKYYYYYSLTGIYSCTENFFCPKEANLVIEDIKKCVFDCKNDKIYIFQYNGECLKKCPENTYPNELNICIEIDKEKCYFTKKELKIDGNLLSYKIINVIVKKFITEFIYTNNHFSQFVTPNNSFILFKNKTCLTKFSSNYTILEFDECITEINQIYNISLPLILIFDRINKYGNPLTSIIFFHPITGEKLITNFCNSMTYNIYKNISQIHKNEFYKEFEEKNIDIYELGNGFYNSLCNNYNKVFKKDILLKKRILTYFPNITICDSNCNYQGTNYSTLISYCKCEYEDSNYTSFNLNNDIDDDYINQNQIKMINFSIGFVDIFETSKIASLICLKYSLYPKNFITNIGGIFITILFIIQIFCIIILIRKNYVKKLGSFINLTISIYIDNKKKKTQNNVHSNYKSFKKLKGKKATENNLSIKEKTEKSDTSDIKQNQDIIKDNKLIYEQKETEKNLNDKVNNYPEENTEKDFKISDDFNIKQFKSYLYLKQKKFSVIDIKNINYIIKDNIKGGLIESYLLKYLSKQLDDLDFYKALRRDKRSYCDFLKNMIVKKNIIVQVFIMEEETKPIFIKLLVFILQIELYFFLNTFFFQPQI